MIRISFPSRNIRFHCNDWEIEIGGTTFPIEWIFYGIFQLEDNLFPTTFIQWNIFVAAAQKRQSPRFTVLVISNFPLISAGEIKSGCNEIVSLRPTISLTFDRRYLCRKQRSRQIKQAKIFQARLPFSSYFPSFCFNPAGSQICIPQCSFRFNKQPSFRYFCLHTIFRQEIIQRRPRISPLLFSNSENPSIR